MKMLTILSTIVSLIMGLGSPAFACVGGGTSVSVEFPPGPVKDVEEIKVTLSEDPGLGQPPRVKSYKLTEDDGLARALLMSATLLDASKQDLAKNKENFVAALRKIRRTYESVSPEITKEIDHLLKSIEKQGLRREDLVAFSRFYGKMSAGGFDYSSQYSFSEFTKGKWVKSKEPAFLGDIWGAKFDRFTTQLGEEQEVSRSVGKDNEKSKGGCGTFSVGTTAAGSSASGQGPDDSQQ